MFFLRLSILLLMFPKKYFFWKKSFPHIVTSKIMKTNNPFILCFSVKRSQFTYHTFTTSWQHGGEELKLGTYKMFNKKTLSLEQAFWFSVNLCDFVILYNDASRSWMWYVNLVFFLLKKQNKRIIRFHYFGSYREEKFFPKQRLFETAILKKKERKDSSLHKWFLRRINQLE